MATEVCQGVPDQSFRIKAFRIKGRRVSKTEACEVVSGRARLALTEQPEAPRVASRASLLVPGGCATTKPNPQE